MDLLRKQSLRLTWTHRRAEGVRLFDDHLEIRYVTLAGRRTLQIPLTEIERADLVSKAQATMARLRVTLKDKRTLVLHVDAPVMWKHDINRLVGANWDHTRALA